MAVEPIDLAIDAQRERAAIHPIPLVKRTLTAFVGRTERGPVNEPVVVRSFDQFRQVFGGHTTLSFVSHTVQHYFQHGGHVAVIVRVVNRATRAAIAVPAGRETLQLEARQPGSQESLRISVDYDGVELDAHRFNLVVQRVSLKSQLIEDQELYPSLSMQPSHRRYVVDALRDSALVRVVAPLPTVRPDATRPHRPGDAVPYIKAHAAGTDGEHLTDYDIIGSNHEGTGLFALLRAEPIDLLCIPPAPDRDLGVTTFVAAERFCGRQRCMLVWDPPWSWETAQAAVRGIRQSQYVSHNALTYFPRIRQRGDLVRYAAGLPSCGAVAGILARHDTTGVWRCLSGETSALKLPFTAVVDLDAHDMAMLKRFGANVITRSATGSFLVHGNATLAGPNVAGTIWQRLEKRRLLFFVLNSIVSATGSVRHGLDDRETARNLEFQVMAFLMSLFKQGALVGQTASQAFMLKLYREADEALALRVGIALRRPGEFVSHDFVYGPAGCAVRPSPALDAEQLVI